MKLTKSDINKILEKYDIGLCKGFEHIWWAYGNYVYIIKTTKGKYILKIHKGNPKFVRYQIEVINFVRSHKLPVPKIIKDREGKEINNFFNKPLVVQEFVEGKPAKDLSNKEIKDSARILAKLLKTLRKLKKTGKYTWGENYQFDKKKFFWKFKKILDLNLENEISLIYDNLEKLNRKKLRRSVIHGDFHSINLFIWKDKIRAIIDWDDIHEDFELQEVTNFICHSFKKNNDLNLTDLKLFIKEFRKNYPLDRNSMKVIYFFIKHRLICSLCWCFKHTKNLKGKKKKEALRNLKLDIDFYNKFNKISFQDWLELIK
jgi:Ser/Thr protein kinase RdoA (MazF antagonist)